MVCGTQRISKIVFKKCNSKLFEFQMQGKLTVS